MPSSSKIVTVQFPTVNIVPPSPSSHGVSQFSNGVPSDTPKASASAQDPPKLWTYRVRGIPIGLEWDAAASLIESTLEIEDWELRSLAPDPVRCTEQVATFEVLQPPYGMLKPRPDSEWQFPISISSSGSTDASTENILENSQPTAVTLAADTSNSIHDLPNQRPARRRKKLTITVDKHFIGLTPLNRPDERQNCIEYDI